MSLAAYASETNQTQDFLCPSYCATLTGCLHEGGMSEKADHPSAICFLQFMVCIQKVVVVLSARIFLVGGS